MRLRAEIGDGLRLYPDPGSDRLREAIARRHGLTPDNVFVGNGSDEVLAHVFLALLKHDAPVLFPDITYSFYPVYCRLYEIAYEQVPLTAAFEIAIDDYLRLNGGIIFPNPNAPTGRFVPLEQTRDLFRSAGPDPPNDCADQLERADTEELLWLAPSWSQATLSGAALASSSDRRSSTAKVGRSVVNCW